MISALPLLATVNGPAVKAGRSAFAGL